MSRASTAGETPPTSVPIGRPPRPEGHRTLMSRLRGRVAIVRRYGVPFFSEFVRDSDTNATVFFTKHGLPVVGKYYVDSPEADAELAAERGSWSVFHDRTWRMPIVSSHRRNILMQRLPDEARMDMQARTMTNRERLDTAVWALDVLIQIYLAGYFHGDLQPHNVWRFNGRLVITDWATFGARSPGVAFADSADVSGHDPGYPRRFDPAFDADDPWSFHNVLGVSLDRAAESLRAQLSRGETGIRPRAELGALASLESGPSGSRRIESRAATRLNDGGFE